MNWILRCAAFVFGLLSSGTLLAQSSPFVPMVPARLLDTRLGNTTVDGQFAGAGPVASLSTLNLTVSGRAGIPASGVGAVALNITVTDPGGSGYLTAWPAGTPVPNASNLNFTAGLSISNQVIAKIGANGQVSIFVYAGTGTANVIADVAGYFPTASDFSPLTPARLLDTRAGMATIDGQFAGGGAIPGGGTLNLTVLGRGGVPASGVKAVVVNVTTANPTASIFVTAWPTGTALPNASNLNAVAGQTIPNLVIVAPGTGGKISLFNSAGSTDLVVDVVGYFSSNTTLSPLVPARLLDTRPGFATIDGQFSGQGAVGAGGTLNLSVLGRGGVPSAGVGAVALNVTAVVPSAAGYIVAWGTGTTSGNFPPRAMDINFRAGDVIPSLVIAQVGPNGQVSLFNSNGSTHLLADVVAWFPSAGSGPPLPPASVAVSAAAGSNSLTASWTLNAGGAAPTYLKIQRATNLAGPWTAVNGSYTPATSGQMAELVFTNATYYYGVAACNAAGCSAYTVSNPGAAISWIPATPVSDAPVIASIPATDPISDRVGATAAQFRVDESGNATYSIPIQAPPGTAGVAPKVALSYNSRLPNGVMGPGWTIEGASQISRCRQTREGGDFASGAQTPDGNPLPVNFSASDRFCLDGVRLLLLAGNSGPYGADGTTYSPETDPTTKVTARVSGSYVGPDSFTVQRKDGTTSVYGYATSSPNALVTAPNPANIQTTASVSWNLARVQDSKGNYIDYIYNSRPATASFQFAAGAVETTLAQINYTGHATSPVSTPYASISFSYATLPVSLVRLGYQGGVAFAQTQQLSCVTVTSIVAQPLPCNSTSATANTVRYYELSYQSSVSGAQFQQISQVRECRDNSKTVCFAPTRFVWSAAQNTFQPGTQYQSSSGPNFTNLAGYKVADVDGDGRQDFVWAVNDNACGTGRSSIYVGFLDRTANGEMTITAAGQAKTCAPINLKDNDRAWYLLDYDGDGRADLLIGGAAGSNWAVYSSGGRPAAGATVFGTINLLASLAPAITVPAGMNAAGVLADVNGDGLPDLITPNYAGPVNPVGGGIFNQVDSGLSVRLLVRSSGTLTFSSPYPILLNLDPGDMTCATSQAICAINFFNTNYQNSSAITTDVNGDGRADLTFLLEATPCGTPQFPNCQARPARGLPRLRFDPKLGLSDEDSSPAAQAGPVQPPSYYWYQFTADGIDASSDPSAPVQIMQIYVRMSLSGNSGLPKDSKKMFFVDLTGDGLADLLYQDASNSSTYHVRVNVGNGYQAPVDVTDISNGTFLQLVDINGDGKIDLVYPTGSSPFTSYSYQSLVPNATAFNGWSFLSTPGTVPGGGLYGYSDWIALIGDFDGDGAPDYLGLSTTVSNNNVYTSRAAAGSRYRPRDVITDFTNGLGAVTRVTYQPLTNIGVYQRGGINGYPALTGALDYGWASPVFDVLAPMYVVSQASSSAPTQADANAFSTVYYRYRGATMQSGGRGFLGFYETWSFDGNDGAATAQHVATINRYAQRYPITGMPIATLKQAVNGATVTRGSPQLDACAANPETAGYNCFSGVVGNASAPDFQFPWPDILSTWGTVFSVGAQTPVCAGPGCLAGINTNVCTLGGNGSQSMARPPDYTAGVFTGSSSVGPVFTYISYTQDATYDLTTGSPAQRAIYALVENWFCYDGNGSTAGTGNLMGSRTLTTDGHGTASAEKVVANAYTDNASNWQLGRLTQSVVKFARPGQVSRSRTTSYTYDAASGLLTSERIQIGGQSDQDLRTLYDLDAWGNRTAAYQCSANLTDSQCRTRSGVNQRQNGLTVLRYARTSYDAIGRYSTGSTLPFYSAAGAWNEQQALSVGRRDEFGNSVQQKSINDSSGYTLNGIATTQWSQYGVLGRPYFAADGTGKAGTTTYRSCSGADAIGCSSDTRFKFRSQMVTVGAPSSWTYYDVLGRPVLQVTRSYDGNDTTKQFSGVCVYTDAHNRTTYQSEPFFLPVAASADGAPNLTASSASPCASATYATISTYDVIGRVVRLTQPDGSAVSKTYSALTTTTSSPRNAVWKWTQTTNVLGELVSTQDPQVTDDASVGLSVTQTYDVFGDVATIVRNAGSGDIVTSYSYDDLGRKISQSDPDSGTTYFSYNAAGEVISQTDQKNQTIALSYDAQGRRWQRTTSNAADGNNLTDTWIYDTALNGYGQLASESRSGTSGATTSFSRGFAYDSYGRLRTRTTTIAGKDYPESTAYDGYGRLKAQQDISGHYVTPGYSANGYSASLSDSRIGTLYQLQTTTARGQVVGDMRGGSTSLQSTLTYYDATGRLSSVCSGTSCGLQDLQYHFDAAGNLDARTRAYHGSATSESFTYDAINRVTQAALIRIQGATPVPIPTLNLSYDQLGNICTKTPLSGGAVVYQYAGRAGCSQHGSLGSPHAAIFVAGKAYGYDANGNQTTNADGRAISYNALNQVTQSVDNGVTVAFEYGPDGDRFKRTDSDAGATLYYVGQVEIRFVAGQANVRRYLMGGKAIDYVRSTGAHETRYVFADHLGSTDVITNPAGQVLESQSFDAHGNQRDPMTWQGSVAATSHIGFTGQEHVNSQGFIHFNGRIYDPTLGRMLQADPVQNPGSQGLNRYAYVVNNPLTLTDPTGYSWFGKLVKGALGIATLGIAYFIPPIYDAFNSLLNNPYIRMAAAIVASYFTFGAVYGAFSAEFLAGTGGTIMAGAAAGAASGFVAGAIQTRSFQMAWRGAVAGAVAGGIAGYYGKAQSLQRVGVEALAGGVESRIQGGDFIDGVKFAFAISVLNYANYRMRKIEWERASQRYYNVDGEGEGMYGIGGKLAGSRREADPDVEYLLGLKCDAPAGGCQGAAVNPGDVRARLGPIAYQPDSAFNRIAESFAGPHDWLRDMTGSYDRWGNSNHFEGFAATLDKIRNYVEIPMAAPFAAAGLVHETPGVYLPLQRCEVIGECK